MDVVPAMDDGRAAGNGRVGKSRRLAEDGWMDKRTDFIGPSKSPKTHLGLSITRRPDTIFYLFFYEFIKIYIPLKFLQNYTYTAI